VLRFPLNGECDIHEPDNGLSRANPWRVRVNRVGDELWVGSFGLARTCSSTDVDYFRIHDSRWYLPFSAELVPAPGVDLQLDLIDSTGTRLLARSANVGSVPEVVPIPLEGSQFFLRVRSQDGSFNPNTPYHLRLKQ